jgi:hypothetical protein
VSVVDCIRKKIEQRGNVIVDTALSKFDFKEILPDVKKAHLRID